MRSKNPWLLLLRLAVFAGAVAFVLSQIDFVDRTVLGEGGHTTVRAGLFTLFGRARLEWLALAFASFFLFTLAGIVRWWLLLETQGIRLRFFETLRLSYIGIFFNNVIPGLTGGDLVKAAYVARRVPDARARAVTSVFVDRVFGLTALLAIGCVAALASLGDPVFRQAALLLIGLLAAGAVATVVLVSRRLRRRLRLDVLLRKLPLQAILQEVDASLREHRLRPGSTALIFLFSLAGQLLGFLDAWCMARALGVDLSLVEVLVVLPVIQVFCLLPISPGAWGVGEGLYVYFFGLVGIAASGAAGISIGSRLIYTVQSLLGGLFLLHAPEDIRRARTDVRGHGRHGTVRPATVPAWPPGPASGSADR